MQKISHGFPQSSVLFSGCTKSQNAMSARRGVIAWRECSRGKFSRGNYFSFSGGGRISDRLATVGESRIARGNIAGILILSYYLISSVTRTNAAPRAPAGLIGPGAHFVHVSSSSVVINLHRAKRAVPRSRSRILSADFALQRAKYTAEPPTDVGRSKIARIADSFLE